MSFLKYISRAGKLLFPSLLWEHKENSPILYLTFDDGPIPEVTPWVIRQLKEYNAKATFFCIGDNVKKHPEIFEQVIAEGHAIGNHSHNHLNGWKTSTKEYLQNVRLAEEAIAEVRSKQQILKSTVENLNAIKANPEKLKTLIANCQNQNPNFSSTSKSQPKTFKLKLFRPPYGRIRPSQITQLKEEGYTIVMWNVISGDYDRNRSTNKCYEEVISQALPGSIVVFHDSEKASKNLMKILPRILEHYKNKGYEFKSL